MLDSTKNLLEYLYKKAYARVFEIRDVFSDQFGANNVDLLGFSLTTYMDKVRQNLLNSNESNKVSEEECQDVLDALMDNLPTILVYFPQVTVTNEYDKSIDIFDLFARIPLTYSGYLFIDSGFQLGRTTFTYDQASAGYIHSHVSSTDFIRESRTNAMIWRTPCLGRGPIKQTVEHLSDRTREYNINFWSLFAFELSKYVTIESIKGVPYIRLESVGGSSQVPDLTTIDYVTARDNKIHTSIGDSVSQELIDNFIQHCASVNLFKFGWNNNKYVLGESITSAVIHMSNEFIKWCNSRNSTLSQRDSECFIPNLFVHHVLRKCIIVNGRITNIVSSPSSERLTRAKQLEGAFCLKFKDRTFNFKLFDSSNLVHNNITILDQNICFYILTKILTTINYKYGKSSNNTSIKYCIGEKFNVI